MNYLDVRSIVESLIAEEASLTHEFAIETVAKATYNKIERMPTFLKIGMAILAIVFNLYGLFKVGKIFRAQTIGQRIRQIEQWRHSSIKAFREFVFFYEKLACFIYFSQKDCEYDLQ